MSGTTTQHLKFEWTFNMIDRNHPAVTRCFPGGDISKNPILADTFAEVIRESLPFLGVENLINIQEVKELMRTSFMSAWQIIENDPDLVYSDPASLFHSYMEIMEAVLSGKEN